MIQADEDDACRPEAEPSFGSPQSSVYSAASSAQRLRDHQPRLSNRVVNALPSQPVAPTTLDHMAPPLKSKPLQNSSEHNVDLSMRSRSRSSVHQVDLSPRSIRLMSQSLGGNSTSHRSPSAVTARASSAIGGLPAPSIPWLSMMEEEISQQEDHHQKEEVDEEDGCLTAARSEASFSSSVGGRSISLGGGTGGIGVGISSTREHRRRYASSNAGDSSVSLGGGVHTSGGGMGGGLLVNKPAFLAESVYDGVKAKLRRMQEEVRSRDDTISSLRKVRMRAEVRAFSIALTSLH